MTDLLGWVKEQVEANEERARGAAGHSPVRRRARDRAAAFRAVQREIEQRGPLLDLGSADPLAAVRGHLEGYADALGLTEVLIDRDELIKALRDDAAKLITLTQHSASNEGPGIDAPAKEMLGTSIPKCSSNEGGGDAVADARRDPGVRVPGRHVARPGLEEESGPETSDEQVKRLRRALEFYATPWVWTPRLRSETAADSDAHKDGGEIARSALATCNYLKQDLKPPALPVEEGGE